LKPAGEAVTEYPGRKRGPGRRRDPFRIKGRHARL